MTGLAQKNGAVDRQGRRQGALALRRRAPARHAILMGDSIATNLFMLGFAWQKGLIPVSARGHRCQAIELNGVAVEFNRQAFVWGRRAAHDLAAVERVAKPAEAPKSHRSRRRYEEIVAKRVEGADRLSGQAAYAERYRALVEQGRESTEGPARRAARGLPRRRRATLYKLMAIQGRVRGGAPLQRLYTHRASSSGSWPSSSRAASS
jgi:hypothetical protein